MRRRRTESFLLRIVVQEDGDQAPQNLRGRVQHIGTGIEQPFAQLEDLIGFITMHLLPVEIEMIGPENSPHP